MPTSFSSSNAPRGPRAAVRPLVLALAGCLAVGTAQADERSDLEQLRATTLALIQALVDQGLISGERAQALLRQASERASAPAPAASAGAAGAATGAAPGVVRVPYIPETLKAQIKEDIKAEVLDTARAEGWADAHKFPDWLSGLRLEGDLRVREESDLLASTNTPASLYQSQTQSPAWSPDLTNTQVNRTRTTLRARLGVLADLSDSTSAELRISTGSTPTSASATVGSGSGYFNRYTVGLDRAWIRWAPVESFSATAGRMASPFFGTDLLWPDDLSLDGLALHAEHKLFADSLGGFATVGAFPLQEFALSTHDKWLFGGQLGLNWALTERTNLRFGASVYDFANIAGKREANPAPTGPLANTQPYYLGQYPAGARLTGNTLIRLNDPTNTGAPVWGLASKFVPVDLTAALVLNELDPVQIGLTLDYVKNTAFDLNDIDNRAGMTLSNLAQMTAGAQARLQIGSRSKDERGSWNAFFAMRRFERDAWLDALTDTTWNLGGTNYVGYSVGGAYAFDRRATVGLRWTSTRNIDDGKRFLLNPSDPTSLTGTVSSAPLRIDVIQLEVNARF
jgi:hypothetical protein